MRYAGWPALALALAASGAPAALAQPAGGDPAPAPAEAAPAPEPAAAEAAAPTAGGVFLEASVGMAVPLGDEVYDGLIDTSFVPTIAGGYFFRLGGGEASIAPEASVSYMPLTYGELAFIENLDEHDVYAGRFRVTGGGRFQVDLRNLYLFVRAAVGFELVHVEWDYTDEVTRRRVDDDESSGGVVLLGGLGFGVRVIDVLGITVGIDFPTALHWDDDDGGIPYNYHSTDMELSLGATIFL